MLRGELVEDEVFEYDQYSSGLGQPGAFEEQFHYIDTGDVTIEPQRQELPVQQLNGHFQEDSESQADPGESFQQVFPQQEQFHPTDHQQDQLHGQFQTQTQESHPTPFNIDVPEIPPTLHALIKTRFSKKYQHNHYLLC